MKTLIGGVLTLVGGALVLYAIYSALMPLLGMYHGALSDPMADANEQQVSRDMLAAVGVGAAGIVPFIIGTLMLKSVFIRRAIRKFGSR